MWTKTSRRFQNDTHRVVLGSLKLLNGAGWPLMLTINLQADEAMLHECICMYVCRYTVCIYCIIHYVDMYISN